MPLVRRWCTGLILNISGGWRLAGSELVLLYLMAMLMIMGFMIGKMLSDPGFLNRKKSFPNLKETKIDGYTFPMRIKGIVLYPDTLGMYLHIEQVKASGKTKIVVPFNSNGWFVMLGQNGIPRTIFTTENDKIPTNANINMAVSRFMKRNFGSTEKIDIMQLKDVIAVELITHELKS